jgi:adenosylmethionine---8-amino-7-oxononanoate aminotransferase
MKSFLVLGTDTDAGKTTFCLLWLAAFGKEYAYWKPVETGESDANRIATLVPEAQVLPPLARFKQPVAPPLAARLAGQTIPSATEMVRSKPASDKPLIIETFGSPFSPLNENELQLALVQAFDLPIVLVTQASVGAIGRSLQVIAALAASGVSITAVVLIGTNDAYAIDQIQKHTNGVQVFSFVSPKSWDKDGLKAVADAEQEALNVMRRLFTGNSDKQVSTNDLLCRDQAAVWHPYTSLLDPVTPLPVVSAQAEYLNLADGHCLIDAVSSWWTTLHGHRHPPLVAALQTALRKFDHVLFAGVTHEPAVELAELLLHSAPWPDGRVFYSDNGSTAVEVALKLAYQYWCHRSEPQRTLFVGFEDGYHGDTFGAMAVGRDPVFFGRFDPLLFRTLQVPVSAQHLDALLSEQGDKVAAIIIEPLVQAAGGMRMHSSRDLEAICDVAKSHQVLVIADEVMTGGGRTGTLWAHQQAGAAPDLICAGKTLTGGMMPLAATMIAPHVVEAFLTPDRSRTFFHGHSYTAHPLACSVAVANWRILQGGSWQIAAQRIERHWRGWADRVSGRSGVTNARVCGTILAFDLVGPAGYLSEVGPRIRQFAIAQGVLLRPLGNVVYAMPPFCTSNASLTRISETMERLLDELVASPSRVGSL